MRPETHFLVACVFGKVHAGPEKITTEALPTGLGGEEKQTKLRGELIQPDTEDGSEAHIVLLQNPSMLGVRVMRFEKSIDRCGEVLAEMQEMPNGGMAGRLQPKDITGTTEHLVMGLIDEVVEVGDAEAVGMAHRLWRTEGLFCGISGGANVLVALSLARELGEGKRVVTVLPDRWNDIPSRRPKSVGSSTSSLKRRANGISPSPWTRTSACGKREKKSPG